MDVTILIQSIQYILPVTVAILGLGIYLFGFQSVKEPDYSYINNIVVTRKKKQQPIKKNGIIQLAKPPPSTNLIIPKTKPEKKTGSAGKENTQPVKKLKTADPAFDDGTDLDQGDWLPAPVRGASNRKTGAAGKQQQGSPKKASPAKDSEVAGRKKPILKETNKEFIASLLTDPVPINEVKHEPVKRVEPKKKETQQKKVANRLFNDELKVEEALAEAAATIVEVQPPSKPTPIMEKIDATLQTEENTEDLWEESKSRGAKKKARARKD